MWKRWEWWQGWSNVKVPGMLARAKGEHKIMCLLCLNQVRGVGFVKNV